MKILSGHISPETAFLVADYPYGFRLRCSIRYWLEFKAGKGVRLMSQTSNPKVAGEPWNKPKGSTYSKFGGAMYLDDAGHVQWSGLHEHSTAADVANWLSVYGAGNHPTCAQTTRLWYVSKEAYDAAILSGLDMTSAVVASRVAAAKEIATLTPERAKEGLRIRRKNGPREDEARKLVRGPAGSWSALGLTDLALPEAEFSQWYVCKNQ